MAVQAQYPSNIPMADFCMSRARQAYGNGSNTKSGFPYSMEDFQFHLMNGSSPANQIALMNSMVGSSPIQQSTLNGAQFTDEFICNINGSNKRPRQSDYVPAPSAPQQQQQQTQQQQIPPEFHRSQILRPVQQSPAGAAAGAGAPPAAGAAPQSTGVSTGLRLAFSDDRLSSSNPAPPKLDLNSSTLSLLSDEIALELQRQREELDQLMRLQQEQMRRAIEEKQQQQSRALLASVERFMSRRLREKEVEMEKVRRRNLELEERVKQLVVEARLWQHKAKNGELMVASLRSNLQQAVVLSREREQSREGVGDTDADDAESSYPGEDSSAGDKQRACKVCRSNEVCMLLLPCRHLCLCKECEARLETCPLCRHPKKASVQVYMS